MREVFEMKRKIIERLIAKDMFTTLIGRKYFWGFEYVKGSTDLFIYDGNNRISKDKIDSYKEMLESFTAISDQAIPKNERDRFLEKFLK